MNIETRIEKLEKKIIADTVIPETERTIVISAHTEEEFEAIKQERIEALRQKYGSNVSAKELLVIFVKKYAFCTDHLALCLGGMI